MIFYFCHNKNMTNIVSKHPRNKQYLKNLRFRNQYVHNDRKVTFYFNNKNATFKVMLYYV